MFCSFVQSSPCSPASSQSMSMGVLGRISTASKQFIFAHNDEKQTSFNPFFAVLLADFHKFFGGLTLYKNVNSIIVNLMG